VCALSQATKHGYCILWPEVYYYFMGYDVRESRLIASTSLLLANAIRVQRHMQRDAYCIHGFYSVFKYADVECILLCKEVFNTPYYSTVSEGLWSGE